MSRERDRKRTRHRKTVDQKELRITPAVALTHIEEEVPTPIPFGDASAFPRCWPRSDNPRDGIDPAYNWADGLSED